MKTDEEIRKEAKENFYKFSIDKSALPWDAWERAYLLAYKDGVIEGLDHVINKLKLCNNK